MITVPAFETSLVADIDELPYVLERPLVYTSVVLQGVVTVPTGFRTDLYSIPFGLRNILPRDGKANGAAVVHDWLYQTGVFACHPITQAIADAVINEAMRCGGMPTWRRVLIYRGLRLGGWKVWNRYRSLATQAFL